MVATQEVDPEDREVVEKLARLQDLHNQVHDLRGLLPDKLLKPTRLALDRPSGTGPGQLAAYLMKAANDGTAEISRFKKNFRNEQMQDLWQKTGAASFPQGRDAWTRDYIALVKPNGQDDAVEKREAPPVNVESNEENEDVQAVITAFKEANPTIKINALQDNIPLPLDFQVNDLRFRISQQEDSESRKTYHVSQQPDKNPSELNTSVLQYLESIGPQRNLAPLLSMLASYQNMQSRHCDACHDIFDNDLAYPIVRKRKSMEAKDVKLADEQWLAYHKGRAI
jgi:hypothetical protein